MLTLSVKCLWGSVTALWNFWLGSLNKRLWELFGLMNNNFSLENRKKEENGLSDLHRTTTVCSMGKFKVLNSFQTLPLKNVCSRQQKLLKPLPYWRKLSVVCSIGNPAPSILYFAVLTNNFWDTLTKAFINSRTTTHFLLSVFPKYCANGWLAGN